MSHVPITKALNDISPGIEVSTTPQLLSFCHRLYNVSKGKTLGKHEIVRYHICAYLTIEKYLHSLNLPDPQINRIPLPSKTAIKLINEFRVYLNDLSNQNSPTKSPKRTPLSSVSTPTSGRTSSRIDKSRMTTPLRSSPLKKLRALADDQEHDNNDNDNNDNDDDDDDDDNDNDDDNDDDNPFVTKSKKRKYVKKTYTPNKTPLLQISIPQLVQLCRIFYIPAPFTKKLLQCFINKRNKFAKKSDWYLACGLVYAAYIRINDKLLKEKHNFKEMVVSQLMRHQQGNIKKANLSYWVSVISSDVKDENWIIDIEKKFIYGIKSNTDERQELIAKLGTNFELLDRLGCMINPHNDYRSLSQTNYFENWSSNILSQLKD